MPSGDSDFAMVSRAFADYLAEHLQECNVAAQDAEELSGLVERFRKALAAAMSPSTGARSKTMQKNDARKHAEKKVRAIGAKIRTDPSVDRKHKVALRLIGLSPRKKCSACPQRPPRMHFVNSTDGVDPMLGLGNGSGAHVLRYYDVRDDGTALSSSARPEGATRVELFVGFLPQGVSGSQIPLTPQEYQRMGFGWPVYLRSYQKSPIEARFPMPDRPMLIVYWARWANEKGEFGAFCKTVVARVEGWSKRPDPELLPECEQERAAKRAQETQVKVQHGAQYALPAAHGNVVEWQRTQATFVLLGTPLALSADAVNDNSDGALQPQRLLSERE